VSQKHGKQLQNIMSMMMMVMMTMMMMMMMIMMMMIIIKNFKQSPMHLTTFFQAIKARFILCGYRLICTLTEWLRLVF